VGSGELIGCPGGAFERGKGGEGREGPGFKGVGSDRPLLARESGACAAWARTCTKEAARG
jgi:hypothetical protein